MEIINFQNQNIRTTDLNGACYYAIVDVVAILTESKDPHAYWRQLKKKLKDEGNQSVRNLHALKMLAADGKMRKTDCLNREGLLRVIQTIPSPNAEPFKIFLAQAGNTYLEETEDSDKMFGRLMDKYRAEGRDMEWIKLRIRSLTIRNALTDSWKKRGVIGKDYANLTDAIHEGTFELTTKEHKLLKELQKNESLRDNMTNLELVFQSLAEELTKQVGEDKAAHGYNEDLDVATLTGEKTGESRKRLEKQLGITVVSNNKWLKKGK